MKDYGQMPANNDKKKPSSPHSQTPSSDSDFKPIKSPFTSDTSSGGDRPISQFSASSGSFSRGTYTVTQPSAPAKTSNFKWWLFLLLLFLFYPAAFIYLVVAGRGFGRFIGIVLLIGMILIMVYNVSVILPQIMELLEAYTGT